VTYHGARFDFAYTVSTDLPWSQTTGFTGTQGDGCGIETWAPPKWEQSRMLSLVPFDPNWLTEGYAPKRPDVVVQLAVDVTDTKLTSISDIQAQIDGARQVAREQQAKGRSWFVPNTTYSQTTLAGQPALRVSDITDQQQSHMDLESVNAIVDGKLYAVRWVVNSKTKAEREQFLKDHNDDLQKIVNSVKLK
jgi:hypothetical protein